MKTIKQLFYIYSYIDSTGRWTHQARSLKHDVSYYQSYELKDVKKYIDEHTTNQTLISREKA